MICSPEAEDSESPPVQPDMVPQQLKSQRANELSSEHSEAILWLPGPVLDEVDNLRQQDPCAVSNVDMNMNSRSPVPNTALTPFYSSASTYLMQAYPSFQPRPILHRLVHPFTQLSVGLDWLHTSRQHPWDIINTPINPESTSWYSQNPSFLPSYQKHQENGFQPFSLETLFCLISLTAFFH